MPYFKLPAAVCALGLALAALFATAAPAQAVVAPPPTTTTIYLVNGGDGRCAYYLRYDGSARMAVCTYDASQQWIKSAPVDSQGSFRIAPAQASGQCLTLGYAELGFAECGQAGDWQLWRLVPTGSGKFQIQSVDSSGFVLDGLPYSYQSATTDIVVRDAPTGNNTQTWSLVSGNAA